MNKHDMINEVCCYYGVKEEDVMGVRRESKIVSAKKVIYYVLRMYGLSFKNIATLLNKDHVTILYTIKNLSEDEKKYANEIYKKYKKIDLEDEMAKTKEDRLKIIELLNRGLHVEEIIKETNKSKDFIISQINFLIDNKCLRKVPVYSNGTYKMLFFERDK